MGLNTLECGLNTALNEVSFYFIRLYPACLLDRVFFSSCDRLIILPNYNRLFLSDLSRNACHSRHSLDCRPVSQKKQTLYAKRHVTDELTLGDYKGRSRASRRNGRK